MSNNFALLGRCVVRPLLSRHGAHAIHLNAKGDCHGNRPEHEVAELVCGVAGPTRTSVPRAVLDQLRFALPPRRGPSAFTTLSHWEIDPRTRMHRVFATGLRNPVGMAWEPETGALWVAVNERDELGSDLVPDYMTSVRDGGFHGWPSTNGALCWLQTTSATPCGASVRKPRWPRGDEE